MSNFQHSFDPVLKKHLETLYKNYDETKLGADPIIFPKRYSHKSDIELIALLASTFAFGNIKQTGMILSKITDFLGVSPAKSLKKYREGDILKRGDSLMYRIYSDKDIDILFTVLASILRDYGTLGELFHMYAKKKAVINPFDLFSEFHTTFYQYAGQYTSITVGLKHMFPDAEKGSACKRANLFLRWMVRHDKIDFGLWDFIPVSNLLIPVDTHIAQASVRLGLTNLKIPNKRMAEQITESLKVYDKHDPVRFDFALCHTEMWGTEF